MNNLLVIVSILLSLKVYPKSYHFSDYEQASQAVEFLKFESESTKMGFITTEFDGYAKDFELNFKKNKNIVTELFLVLKAESLDTDNSSRDEKMHESIIESKKYPAMTFALLKPFELKEGEIEIEGRLTIRNQTRNKKINLRVKKEADNSYSLNGTSHFSLKDFQVPDPSIAIASVRDQFDVKFSVKVTE